MTAMSSATPSSSLPPRASAFIQGAVTATLAIVSAVMITGAKSPGSDLQDIRVEQLVLKVDDGTWRRIHVEAGPLLDGPSVLATASQTVDRRQPRRPSGSPSPLATRPGGQADHASPLAALALRDHRGQPRLMLMLDEQDRPVLMVLDHRGRPARQIRLDRLPEPVAQWAAAAR